MHPFSTNSEERKLVPFFLAVLAIAMGVLTTYIFSIFHTGVPWWAPPLDTMSFYGLLFWLFDRFVWKWCLVHWSGISRLPNLEGRWRGRVEPANGEENVENLGIATKFEMTISQTWLGLLLISETERSRSRSISAALLVGEETSLTYEYINEPRASAPATMHTHRGTARLVISGDGRTLNGEYYTGRDRQSFGSIS